MPGIGLIHNSKGFSLIEVLLGISVFMIGMLGVTALNISSLKSGTFSGNMSEATSLAASKIEELMILDYDDISLMNDTDGDGTGQDPTNVGSDTVVAGGTNFGLDHVGVAADHPDPDLGRNNMFDVYWNIAVDEPMPDNKTINVIVEWDIKGIKRWMNIQTVRMKTL